MSNLFEVNNDLKDILPQEVNFISADEKIVNQDQFRFLIENIENEDKVDPAWLNKLVNEQKNIYRVNHINPGISIY